MATADIDNAALAAIEETLNRVRVAFEPLVDAMNRVTAAFRNIGRSIDAIEAKALRSRRAEFGGNATDAARWPDGWQSVQCAAWLPDCPSDEYDLRCTGRRHQRVWDGTP